MIIKTIKARINLQKNDFDDILKVIQKHKIMMIDNSFYNLNENTETEDEYLEKASKIIKILESFGGKKKFFQYDEVSYDKFSSDTSDEIYILDEVEELYLNLEDKKAKLQDEKNRLNFIKPFENLSIPTDIVSDDYVSFKYCYLNKIHLNNFLSKCLDVIEVEQLGESEDRIAICLCYLHNDEITFKKIFNEFDLVNVELPISSILLSKEIKNIENEINLLGIKINEINEKLINHSKNINDFKLLADKLVNDKTRKIVTYKKENNQYYFEGYIKETDKEQLKTVIEEATSKCDFDFYEPNSKELFPTATKNNKFVEPFESITNMFDVPDPNEIDPNPVMSVWYWLFFGFMMGDIGYGLVMILVCWLFLKFKNPKPNMKPLVKIFLFSGFSSVIFGIFFGSFFGESFGVIKFIGSIFGADWPVGLLLPVDDPLGVLFASIIIGAFHLISALIMKVRLAVKHKNLADALYGIGWSTCLVGIGVTVVGFVLLSGFLKVVGMIILGLAIVCILYTGTLGSKGLKKITGALGGITKATSYLSDLLSYSRLLALCLSASIIGSTMNLLAGMLQGGSGIMGIVGILFSIVVYIIGHVFNLVLSLLSCYIHSSRLQYIEFFGKFYIGGGIEFKPFQIELNYLDGINYMKKEA